jgi:hypothetical protein
LNKKGDATEALISLLNILHYDKALITDEKNNEIINFDQKCGSTCFIHEYFNLNIKQERRCRCGKTFPEQENLNNFILNIILEGEGGFLSHCEEILKQANFNQDPPARS